MSRALASTQTDDNRCSPCSKSMPWHLIIMKEHRRSRTLLQVLTKVIAQEQTMTIFREDQSNSIEFSFNSLSKDINHINGNGFTHYYSKKCHPHNTISNPRPAHRTLWQDVLFLGNALFRVYWEKSCNILHGHMLNIIADAPSQNLSFHILRILLNCHECLDLLS